MNRKSLGLSRTRIKDEQIRKTEIISTYFSAYIKMKFSTEEMSSPARQNRDQNIGGKL
jgi:hypothetical protein